MPFIRLSAFSIWHIPSSMQRMYLVYGRLSPSPTVDYVACNLTDRATVAYFASSGDSQVITLQRRWATQANLSEHAFTLVYRDCRYPVQVRARPLRTPILFQP
eukprot:4098276-Pyramimonas_sp.AAC.2